MFFREEFDPQITQIITDWKRQSESVKICVIGG